MAHSIGGSSHSCLSGFNVSTMFYQYLSRFLQECITAIFQAPSGEQFKVLGFYKLSRLKNSPHHPWPR
jgi:hypothetical protein